MELELDLKITKNVDDLQSAEFWIAKDRAGPIFLSRETEIMFVLTAHLRGYRAEDINIDINEDGTLISISCDKFVQELGMKGWVMEKKEPQPNLKGFVKVLRIPKEVELDQIKANYNDEEATLTIYMPKRNMGIIGSRIEQVSDENKLDQQIDDEEEQLQLNQEVSKGERCSTMEDQEEKIESEFNEQTKVNQGCETETSNGEQELANKNNFTLCMPCFFIGSTLVASFIALFVGLVRSRKK